MRKEVANPQVAHLRINPMMEYNSTRISIKIRLPLMSNKNSEPYIVVSSKPNLNWARNIIDSVTLIGIVKKCTNFGL